MLHFKQYLDAMALSGRRSSPLRPPLEMTGLLESRRTSGYCGGFGQERAAAMATILIVDDNADVDFQQLKAHIERHIGPGAN